MWFKSHQYPISITPILLPKKTHNALQRHHSHGNQSNG